MLTAHYSPSVAEARAIRMLGMGSVWSAEARENTRRTLHKMLTSVRSLRIRNLARAHRPDITIVIKGETLPSVVLEQIKDATRGPMVTWWADDPFQFPEWISTSQVFDAFFVFDEAYIPGLRDVGAQRVTLLPCACDPGIYFPRNMSVADRRRYASDLAFVALYYPPREKLVEHMAGLELAVWGPGWNVGQAQRSLALAGKSTWRGKSLPPSKVAKVYNATKICVNVHHGQSKYNGINKRGLEILACGTFQMMDHLAGLHTLLTPGKDLVCFHSMGEARELADYYLQRPNLRIEIGQRGKERVLRDHTYKNRMCTLLDTVDVLL